MEERRHKSYELILDTNADASRLVEASAREFATLGNGASTFELGQEYALGRLTEAANERFEYLGRASKYLHNLAKLMSIDDYRASGGDLTRQLEWFDVSNSGEIFELAAKIAFMQREKQLRQDFGFKRSNPKYHISGYGYFTKVLPKFTLIDALEVADDLRSKSERMANSSGFPWQPLSKHLHQTIDPQRIHGQEVALGVGFGAILVRSAYGRKMIRHNDHVRTRTEKTISLLQRQYDLMPNTRYDELDVYYEDD